MHRCGTATPFVFERKVDTGDMVLEKEPFVDPNNNERRPWIFGRKSRKNGLRQTCVGVIFHI